MSPAAEAPKGDPTPKATEPAEPRVDSAAPAAAVQAADAVTAPPARSRRTTSCRWPTTTT